MFRNIKLTIRSLRRSGVYSIVNIAGLAMSLATCVFIVLWVQDERSYDGFHRDAENIYMAYTQFESDGGIQYMQSAPGLFANSVKEDFAAADDFCRLSVRKNQKLVYEDINSSSICVFTADPNFFDFFNFPIVNGNKDNPFRNPNDAVISERVARELFENEDPVGKIIRFAGAGKSDVHVTAVMKNMPRNTNLEKTDLVMSFSNDTAYQRSLNSWNSAVQTFLKLKPWADIDFITQQFNEKHPRVTAVTFFVSLRPFVNVHLYSDDGEPKGLKTVRMFQWVAIIILVIACINYVNLVTARATKRHREIGLKKIVGAKKWQLFLQLIGEAMVLFVIAIFVALLLNFALIPLYNQLSGKEITFRVFDVNVWRVYITMLVVVVALAGVYPAYLLASFKPINVVQTFTVKRGSNYFRKMLVVMQFIASTALITGTIVLFLQMKYIREKDLGYDRSNMLTCSIPRDIFNHYDVIKTELERQTSILGVTAAYQNILNVDNPSYLYKWEGKMVEEAFMCPFTAVDTSFLRVMRFTLVDGTNFTSTQSISSPWQVILNETAIKMMGLSEPVGKWIENNEHNIVGIVKDFHFQSMHKEITPMMFTNQRVFNTLYVRIQPGNTQQAIAIVEKMYKQYNLDRDFEYRFMDDTFIGMYSSEIKANRLFTVFSVIAILISCLGLLGLVIFTSELKTKEIGIRKVLGASIFDIVKLLTREFVILVGIAIVIAIPLAYYLLDRMLQDFAYRISLSWWIFVVAALTTIVLTLLTVNVVAIKAAMADPVKSLKME